VVSAAVLVAVAAPTVPVRPVQDLSATVSTIAGVVPLGCSDAPRAAQFCPAAYDLVERPDGTRFFIDRGRIVQIDTDSSVRTVVSNGGCRDREPVSPLCPVPRALALDQAGRLYFVDQVGEGSYVVRRLERDGSRRTVAGREFGCEHVPPPTDGEPARTACINPTDGYVPQAPKIAVDPAGRLVLALAQNFDFRGVVYRVDDDGRLHRALGTIGTVGCDAAEPTQGPGRGLCLPAPDAIAAAPDGSVVVSARDLLLRLRGDGEVVRLAGGRAPGWPTALALDRSGAVYLAKQNVVRRFDVDSSQHVVAGSGRAGTCGDGGPAAQACLDIQTIATGPDGRLDLLDSEHGLVRSVDRQGVIQTTIGAATNMCREGGPALKACDIKPNGLTRTRDGSLVFGDADLVRELTPDGRIHTVAGSRPQDHCADDSGGVAGRACFCGDGGPAIHACFADIEDVAIDERTGALYVADTGNNRVRRIDPDGRVSTVAGDGRAGDCGDRGPAIQACVRPGAVVLDPGGGFWVSTGQKVRHVDAAGTITTVAGRGRCPLDIAGSLLDVGDGGPATDACLENVTALASTPSRTLLIADATEGRVRAVDRDGIIRTVAGNGLSPDHESPAPVCLHEEGPARGVCLPSPTGLAVADDGEVYITNAPSGYGPVAPLLSGSTAKVWRLDNQGLLTVVAGHDSNTLAREFQPEDNPGPACGTSFRDTPARLAGFDVIGSIALDPSGNRLYIAETYCGRIDEIDLQPSRPGPGAIGHRRPELHALRAKPSPVARCCPPVGESATTGTAHP
jgi:DNA-binding beta-propeller fold protein YncE